MIERCIAANFDVLALTVDTITGGNRERDLRTGFTSPPRLTLKSLLSFAMRPRWAANYFMHEKFELPQLKDYVKEGSNISVSVGDYFSTMLDQSMKLERRRGCRQKMGKAVLSQGHHERRGREACRGYRRNRHHGVQSWRASARRVKEPL
jgi:L-lactate dehydrogenase (cytochrome)